MVVLCILLAMLFGMANTAMAESDAALSLRSAVASNATVTLSGDITLESSLTIPTGRTITINGTGRLSGTSDVEDLIVVEAGATVTFAGSIELNGAGITGSILSTKGNVAITEKVKITGADMTANDTGAVEVLNGGYLKLAGGSITGNIVRNNFCGTVYVANGGKISIEPGADISSNIAYDSNQKYSWPSTTSGVFLAGGATGRMIGGKIYKNQSMRGAAIMLYSLDAAKKATFTFSGGEIYENTGKTDNGKLQSSGAVHIEGNASFRMCNGVLPSGDVSVPVIRNNQATGIYTNMIKVSGMGGGVCVRDPGLGAPGIEATSSVIFRTEFIMDGGKISDNTANTGGGIYVFSDGVVLRSGVISGNRARRQGNYNLEFDTYGMAGMGGGIYCEGNTQGYSTLQLRDAVITNNTAGFEGGGVWFCPTGSAMIYPRHGASIHDNTASGPFGSATGAGDDFFFGAAVSKDMDGQATAHPMDQIPKRVSTGGSSGTTVTKVYPSLTLSDQALGGVDINWYMDGFMLSNSRQLGIFNNSLCTTENIYGTKESRYLEGRNPKVSGITNGYWYSNSSLDKDHFYAYALKCIASEEALRKADFTGKLFITENIAFFGGGIGANGGVTIGEAGDPNMDLVIEKKWDDSHNKHDVRPKQLGVELYLNGNLYDTVTLSEANGWRVELTNLPLGKYSVKENTPWGYTVSYQETNQSTKTEEKLLLTITNTLNSKLFRVMPKTGDDSMLVLWGLMALVSAAGAAWLIRKSRKA